MDKSKIDWCDSTWNPVTGCLHGCEYCYARRIAERFSPFDLPHLTEDGVCKHINDLKAPIIAVCKDGKERICAYPYGFEPTFHRYRLSEYIGKKGRNIFVCSMADLFGKWVPNGWIKEVFMACDEAPQHNFLFLTKNPERYVKLQNIGKLIVKDNIWYGATIANKTNIESGKALFYLEEGAKCFLSIEPLLEDITIHDFWIAILNAVKWVIIGAETSKRKDKIIPKREWIEQIVEDCRQYNISLFMKSSLADIWGDSLIQEFPEGLRRQ